MKKIIWIKLLCLIACPVSFAQAEDDLIIVDESSESHQNDFAKAFSGEVLGSYAGLIDQNNTRHNLGIKLRYAQSFDSGLSLVAEGYAYASGVKLQFEQEDITNQTTRDIEESVNNNNLELREAYVRFNNRFIDIYAGRRLLVLGQFNAFSPVDFVLPVDLSNSKVEFTKAGNRYPQTTLSLHVYPTPQLELQLHYFFKIERDPITRDLLEDDEPYVDQSGDLQTASFEYPDNEAQYIGRLVYNGQNLTTALTYYKGFELYPASRPRLVLDSNNNPITNARMPEPSYPKNDGYGFEIAIPRNKFVYKYEMLLLDQYTDFQPCTTASPACDNYHAVLNDSFDGKAYASARVLFHAVGFDYSGDDWTMNIAIYQAVDISDSDVEEARDISEELSSNELAFNGIFPSLNIARHWGRDKQHTTGLAGGLLGSIAGATAYHGWEVRENLTLSLSFEVFLYQSDLQTEDQIEDRANREQPNNPDGNRNFDVQQSSEIAPALRFGFRYSF